VINTLKQSLPSENRSGGSSRSRRRSQQVSSEDEEDSDDDEKKSNKRLLNLLTTGKTGKKKKFYMTVFSDSVVTNKDTLLMSLHSIKYVGIDTDASYFVSTNRQHFILSLLRTDRAACAARRRVCVAGR